jgi:hypothetical protein
MTSCLKDKANASAKKSEEFIREYESHPGRLQNMADQDGESTPLLYLHNVTSQSLRTLFSRRFPGNSYLYSASPLGPY